VRTKTFILAIAAAVVMGVLPSGAVPVPVVASDNVELLATFPDVSAISTAFATDKPLMYVNTVTGISTYDITDPTLPLIKSHLALPHFENEGMTLGERADGTKFLLVGIDMAAVAPTSSKPYLAGSSLHHVYVIDVTDPAAPKLRGNVDTKTSSHTITCVGKECNVAYTSGAYNKNFSVIDLSNLDSPKWVKDVYTPSAPSPIAAGSGSGHQWTVDDAGLMWVAGWGGTAVFDVKDPLNPVALAMTDVNATKAPYNDFIQHNVYRPFANKFTQTRDASTGRLTSGSKETASVFDGNVAMITEEDYDSPDCQGALDVDAPEGGFSTWWLSYQDNAQFTADKATMPKGSRAAMTPLDSWNTELFNTGTPTPAGALCSAHYFTFHQAGFVAQGWYQEGTRILDVRNPRDIKQVGYFFAGTSETWHAYFVPARDASGKTTGEMTNIIYTNDVARGIDVLRVTFPTTTPADTAPLKAPILPQWLTGDGLLSSAASDKFGYVCRLAGTFGAK
jgi:hypothetical protein